jgi:hypothetical protein
MPGGQHQDREGSIMPKGEQNARGSSMRMGSSITGLYIASLHEIEDPFVSGFEFEKQLYI